MLEVGKEGMSHAGAQIFVSRGLWKVMAKLRLQACREAVFGAPCWGRLHRMSWHSHSQTPTPL